MKKILIVEDEPASLKLMSAILRGAGYQVVTAQDAIGAVSTAKPERPDLMVLDVNLPGGDALVVIKRLSTIGAMTPLVVVSASEINRQRALDAGARRLARVEELNLRFSVSPCESASSELSVCLS